MRKNFLRLAIPLIAVLILSTPAFGTPWEDCGVSHEDYTKAIAGTKIVKDGVIASSKIIETSPPGALTDDGFLQSIRNTMHKYLGIINEVIEYYPCNAEAYLLRAQIQSYLSLSSTSVGDQKHYASLAYFDAQNACDMGYNKACDSLNTFADLLNQ